MLDYWSMKQVTVAILLYPVPLFCRKFYLWALWREFKKMLYWSSVLPFIINLITILKIILSHYKRKTKEPWLHYFILQFISSCFVLHTFLIYCHATQCSRALSRPYLRRTPSGPRGSDINVVFSQTQVAPQIFKYSRLGPEIALYFMCSTLECNVCWLYCTFVSSTPSDWP